LLHPFCHKVFDLFKTGRVSQRDGVLCPIREGQVYVNVRVRHLDSNTSPVVLILEVNVAGCVVVGMRKEDVMNDVETTPLEVMVQRSEDFHF
jgi:hypothetical protein